MSNIFLITKLRPVFTEWSPRFLTYEFAMLAGVAFLAGDEAIESDLNLALGSITKAIGVGFIHVLIEVLARIGEESPLTDEDPESNPSWVSLISTVFGLLTWVFFFTAAIRFWLLINSAI
jgi:hypothetical protein